MTRQSQRTKKVVSDSPGLEDFVVGQMVSIPHLLNGQVNFLGKFETIQITELL